MADFKTVINVIESKVGEEVTRQLWTAKLLSVFDKRIRSIKILVRFTKDDFIFDDEIKLVEQHFNEDTKYGAEIIRRLQRLNDYTDAISSLKADVGKIPNLTARWKAYISNLVEMSPIESSVTVTFIKNGSGEVWSFDKQMKIYANEFISLQVINRTVSDAVDKLNEPINITYYLSLINL